MPLTVNGLTAQILGCITTYKANTFRQEDNDCKVALNRLVRAFGEVWIKNPRKSVALKNHSGKITKEHVVPVKVIMEGLLSMELKQDCNESFQKIKDYLEKHVVIALITDTEDACLRRNKLQSSMPEDWDREDIFSRYIASGIILETDAHPVSSDVAFILTKNALCSE